MAVEVTLRLLPVPECYRTILAAYDRVEDAGEAVSRIVASGLLPGAMEIMDRLAIEAAEAAEVSPPPAPLRRELQASESGEVGRSRPG